LLYNSGSLVPERIFSVSLQFREYVSLDVLPDYPGRDYQKPFVEFREAQGGRGFIARIHWVYYIGPRLLSFDISGDSTSDPVPVTEADWIKADASYLYPRDASLVIQKYLPSEISLVSNRDHHVLFYFKLAWRELSSAQKEFPGQHPRQVLLREIFTLIDQKNHEKALELIKVFVAGRPYLNQVHTLIKSTVAGNAASLGPPTPIAQLDEYLQAKAVAGAEEAEKPAKEEEAIAKAPEAVETAEESPAGPVKKLLKRAREACIVS
jgi:hypothetical protein